jgi:Tol biopolymer transport system component
MRSGAPVGEPVQLTTGLNARTISLSVDGSRIAYDIVRHRSNIWSVAIPASGAASIDDARVVTNGYERVEGIRISHDGAWLAYDSDRGGNSDIYKVRAEGGDPVRLTDTPENEFSPAWSPDDREIAFHAVRAGDRDIEMISANGGDRRQVTRGPRRDYCRRSPDGRSIASSRRPRICGRIT